MRKKELIKRIALKTGVPEFDVEMTLRGLAKVIVEQSVSRGTIMCKGLMSVRYKYTKAKTCKTNLKTLKPGANRTLFVPEKIEAVFRISDDLQREVNAKALPEFKKENAAKESKR